MMIKSVIALILVCLLSPMAWSETVKVPLQTSNDQGAEEVLTKSNLDRIKAFIIKGRKRETYCNMYSNNPAHEIKPYKYYLNPDTGQSNAHCDIAKSDFNELVVRNFDGRPQYIHIKFKDKNSITMGEPWPADDVTIAALKTAVRRILKEINSEPISTPSTR